MRNDKGQRDGTVRLVAKRKHQQGAFRVSKAQWPRDGRGRGNLLVPWTKQGTQRVACADGSTGLMLGREGVESSESSPGRGI